MRIKASILIYLIFVFQNISSAQSLKKPDRHHINFKALMFKSSYSPDQLYSFNVDIYRDDKSVKVVYFVLDSFTAKTMFDNFMVYADTAAFNSRFFLNIDSIALKKFLYKKDSIEFEPKSNLEYTVLIDSSFLPNAHQFDSKLSPDNIHLDGVFYKFTFEDGAKIIRIFGSISPTNYDYPFLTRLIKETFNLYKPNNKGLLNKANSNGRY